MDLNEIGKTSNSKQVEYLNDIRTLGMGIIYGQTTMESFVDTFKPYIDYVTSPNEYLQGLKLVAAMINENECTPDDLLLNMGRFVPDIEYEDEELSYDYDDLEELDYEDDDYIECRTEVTVKHDDDDIEIKESNVLNIDLDDLSDEQIHKILSVLFND